MKVEANNWTERKEYLIYNVLSIVDSLVVLFTLAHYETNYGERYWWWLSDREIAEMYQEKSIRGQAGGESDV